MKLNIGSNAELIKDWTNIDIEPIPGVIQHDARNPFPFTDNSCQFIFSEHFIEHLTELEATNFFKECYRLLRPGGVIRTVTFNIETLFKGLQRWDEYKLELYNGHFKDYQAIQFLNMAIYEAYNHKWMYNEDEMIRLLTIAGFSKFNIQSFRKSEYPELCNLEYRSNSDCIVEAVK